MCITEVWTYRDCGCRFEHVVTCHPSFRSSTVYDFDENKENEYLHQPKDSPAAYDTDDDTSTIFTDQNSPSKRSRCSMQYGTWLNSSPRKTRDIYKSPRECSVHHQVSRDFLEPICDDCIIAEVRSSPELKDYLIQSPNAPHYDTKNGEGLIIESNVEISLVPSGNNDRHFEDQSEVGIVMVEAEPVLDSNVEVEIMEAMQDGLSGTILDTATPAQDEELHGRCKPTTPPQLRPESSLTTGNEADDEGSLHPLSPVKYNRNGRCRLRTRSKELRRQGMDISREELRLRIASGWTSGEKRSMENFKRFLKGEDDGAVLSQPDSQTIRRGRSSVKDWAKDVADRVGRSLGSQNRKPRDKGVQGRSSPLHSEQLLVPSLQLIAMETNSCIETNNSSSSVNTTFGYDTDAQLADNKGTSGTPKAIQQSSWDEHLEQDLSRQRRSRQRCDFPQDTVTISVPDVEPKTGVETRRDFQSPVSTVPSIPMTSSVTGSTSFPGNVLPLEREIESGDHEVDEEDAENWYFSGTAIATGRELSADGETTSIDDSTSIAITYHENNTMHTGSIQWAPSSTPTPTLSFHPLTTPLSLTPPVREHPTPTRSDSLSSTLYRFEHEPRMAITQSPMSAFVCVRERVIGARGRNGCGGVVGQKVVSCVCDGAEGGETVGGAVEIREIAW